MTAAMTAAKTFDETLDVRTCEVCGGRFPRPLNVSRTLFARRQTCSATCRGIAARKDPERLVRKPARAQATLQTAKPYEPRIVNGTWRPNAPGWPDTPHIPGRVTS